MYLLHKIKISIFNLRQLVSWIPILLSDRQYDHVFLYIILRHKLNLMYEFYKSEYASSALATANKIKLCILILNRLIEDNYADLAGYYKIDKKWGPAILESFPIENRPGYKSLNIRRDGVISPKDNEALRKDLLKYSKKESELEKQDINYLFNTLAKYSRTWWD